MMSLSLSKIIQEFDCQSITQLDTRDFASMI